MNDIIIIRCIKCGFAEEKNINDLMQTHLEPICPQCYNVMIVEDDDIDDDLPNVFDQQENIVVNANGENLTKEELNEIILTDSFENEIRQYGNQLIYDHIEIVKNAIHRLKYRKYFLLAGGFIPKQKIKGG